MPKFIALIGKLIADFIRDFLNKARLASLTKTLEEKKNVADEQIKKADVSANDFLGKYESYLRGPNVRKPTKGVRDSSPRAETSNGTIRAGKTSAGSVNPRTRKAASRGKKGTKKR